MKKLFFAVVMAVAAAACGGDSAATPAAPTNRTTAVTLTLTSPLIMGTTQQATASATQSAGGAQAVTTGFKSDVPAVATVTDAGLVSAMTNGVANIYVVSGGAQGLANVRVIPSYSGQWRGSYSVRSCTQTGIFTSANLCTSTFVVNHVLPTTMTLTQNGTSVAGTFFLGSVAFGSVNGPIESDGATSFSATGVDTSVAITTVSWRINSPQVGRVTGVHSQLWRANGASGEMRVDSEIVDWLNKTSSVPVNPARITSLADIQRAISAR
jgi:hypothetical protein